MTSNWQRIALNELYEFSSGLSKPRSAFGSGYPFLSFKDVFYNSAVPENLTERVISTAQERVRCSVARGDVFLTRTSETMDELGMSSVALADIPNATFNGFTKRLRPKQSERVVPEFARYYFRSPEFRSGVTAMTSMSTRASLNNEMLSRLNIVLPSRAEQEIIGQTLGSLDGRITLLRETNKTLESIAQAIFKSWFVDFDPVRAKMEGRQPEGMDEETVELFPDSLEDSEFGLVPNGWHVGCLNDLSTLNPESWTAKKHPEMLAYVDLANTKENAISGVPVLSFDAAPSRARRVLRKGDSIVGTVRPGNKSFAFIGSDLENLTGSTGFAVLRPKQPQSAEFIYITVTQESVIDYLSHVADGGAYPAVRPEVVAKVKTILPSDKALKKFHEIVSPLFKSVANNQSRMEVLTATRDNLLPRLISGQLRIPEAQERVEEALT